MQRTFATALNQDTTLEIAQFQGLKLTPLSALGWCLKLVDLVSKTHDEGLVFGRLSARDIVLQLGGGIRITAAPKRGCDLADDIFELGLVLSQILRMANEGPELDPDITYVMSLMLDADPGCRPSSLAVVEALLGDVFDVWNPFEQSSHQVVEHQSPRPAARAHLALV